MAKFDTESLIDSIITLFKNNISTKLTEITSEKGDSLTLEVPNNSAYFINESPALVNYNPYVIVGIESVAPTSAGVSVKKDFKCFVAILHSTFINDTNVNAQRRIMRYARAFQEVLSENFDKITPGHSQVKITEFPSNPQLETQSGEIVRVAGLSFNFSIA
ncbi:MAG: hypothetical protein KC483_11445 [Nitrosarchaeum sp.]|nr:hypothetical protein [Nitrosarchaeum sp.]